MRRFIFSLISFLGCFASHAQDTIVKLSGERFIGRVIANRPNLIEFNYPNETSLNTVPKPLISYVSYSSGRREDISEIVNISGEGGWKNVLVTTNPDEVLGLVRLGEVRAKSNSLVNLNSVVGVDKRASENIQKGAVALGAHIILMLQNETKGETGISLAQSFKSGIAYGYPFETTDTKLPFNLERLLFV